MWTVWHSRHGRFGATSTAPPSATAQRAMAMFSSWHTQLDVHLAVRLHYGSDGGNPTSNVIFDASGNLYGTASTGGNLSCGSGEGCGVVWKITR